MNLSACERLAEIALAEAEGKMLVATDLAFQQQHLETCEECLLEKRALDLLRFQPTESSHFVFDAVSRQKIIEGTLSQLREDDGKWDPFAESASDQDSQEERASPKVVSLITKNSSASASAWRKPTRWLAGLAAAAAVFLVVRSVSNSPEENRVVAAAPLSKVLLASAGLTRGMPVFEGQLFAGKEEMALALGPDIVVLLEPNSRAHVSRLNGSSAEITLENGRIHASVRPHSSHFQQGGFSVATSQGRVTVTGTLFSVEASRDLQNGSAVSVLRGSVKVTSSNGQSQVQAMQTQQIGSRQARKMSIQEQKMAQAATERIRQIEQGDLTASNRPSSSITGNEIPSISLAKPKIRPKSKEIASVSAQELLRRAQVLRRQQNWEESAKAYRELLMAYSGSEIAENARVSLGLLQVEHLKDFQGGLRSCEEYLLQRPEGSIAGEAALCRIKALRILGRRNEERQAIEKFLDSFPNAAQVSSMRNRIQELRGAGQK